MRLEREVSVCGCVVLVMEYIIISLLDAAYTLYSVVEKL